MPKFPVPPGGHKLSGAFINSSAPQTNVYILNMFPKGRINSAKDSHLLTCSLILLAACAAQIFGLLQISTRKIWKMFLLFFFFFCLVWMVLWVNSNGIRVNHLLYNFDKLSTVLFHFDLFQPRVFRWMSYWHNSRL